MDANNLPKYNENKKMASNLYEDVKKEIKEEDEVQYVAHVPKDGNQSSTQASPHPNPNLNVSVNLNAPGPVRNQIFYILTPLPKATATISTPLAIPVIEVPKIEITIPTAPVVPEEDRITLITLTPQVQPEVRPNDVCPKPKHICVTDKIRLFVEDDDDDDSVIIIDEPEQPVQNVNEEVLSAPIHQIPKEVLDDYGLKIEAECSSGQTVTVVTEDDTEGSQNLVIDEGKDTKVLQSPNGSPKPKKCKKNHKTKQDEDGKIAENNNETPKPEKPSEEDVANSEHHLVVSSVVSLKKDVCSKCDQRFPGGISLLEHETMHCSFNGCQDYFEEATEKEKHEQLHRDCPQKPFRCESCRKRFQFYKFALKHREICRLLQTLQCQYCEYTSTRARQFKKHVSRHINTIQCTGCKKKFLALDKFTKHANEKHRKDVYFQCTDCPRRFCMPESIRIHIGNHGLTMEEVGIARYVQVQEMGRM